MQSPLLSGYCDRPFVRTAIKVKVDGYPDPLRATQPHVHVIVGLNLQRTQALHFGENLNGHPKKPNHQVNEVALVQERPPSQLPASHEEILIAFPGVPIS